MQVFLCTTTSLYRIAQIVENIKSRGFVQVGEEDDRMEKGRLWGLVVLLLLCLCFGSDTVHAKTSTPKNKTQKVPPSPLKLVTQKGQVVMDNGIVKVTLSVPGGMITQISYKGISNILDTTQPSAQRGYWDLVWAFPGENATFNVFQGTNFKVIAQTGEKIELSFKLTYNPSSTNTLPLNIDKRFVILPGLSGFYTYAIYERLPGWPSLDIAETRIAFKLDQKMFRYMAISDDKQRIMPSGVDRDRGQPLAYKEAVLIKSPSPKTKDSKSSKVPAKTEVDDKYQYSLDNKDYQAHGWISTDKNVGFWVILPSYEFRTGGPMKRELTSHVASTSLATFFTRHYAGATLKGLYFEDGEPWKKVFGPLFIYLNNGTKNQPSTLWNDAKQQFMKEVQKWPYKFPMSPDFPLPDQRATISGVLLINDGFLQNMNFPAKSGYVGLATPGVPGSWQIEAKGYQFWTQTDFMGSFTIKNIRAGTYNLYAWVPGIFGDYMYETNIVVSPGNVVDLGIVVFNPPRNGPTIWEIGIPDRTAAEFYVPDPLPGLTNPLYNNLPAERYRQYGLWDRYTDLYPNDDLMFNTGVDDYRKNWFYAHVNRKLNTTTYVPTSWQVSFDMTEVIPSATYTLRLAIASATFANVQVRVNDPLKILPDFSTGRIGQDNAIARHGPHGLYWAFSFSIPGNRLVVGSNSIYLRQSTGGFPFVGAMYDYLRLEGPSV